MHDLNHQLKQLCEKNRDGSFGTQAQRAKVLQLSADQLVGIGYRHLTVHTLKPKHVEALANKWLQEGLSSGTVKNRMSALRWWAMKVNRQNVIANSNAHYGIPDRKFVAEESKAKSLTNDALDKIRDTHVRMSLELQRAFGLRREEAIKFSPSYADRGDHLELKASWTKGGKARVIPIRTAAQREVLNRARQLAGLGALIPSNRNYIQQLRLYEGQTLRAGLCRMHGLTCLRTTALSRTHGLPSTRRRRSSLEDAHCRTKSARPRSASRNQPRTRSHPPANHERLSRPLTWQSETTTTN